MYLGTHANLTPDKSALVAPSGTEVTYAELNVRSNQLAHYFRSLGLQRGDHIAAFLENNEHYFDIFWAALRSGLYLTPVNSHLTEEEAGYIVKDCAAQVLITSTSLADVAISARRHATLCHSGLMIGGEASGFDNYAEALASQPETVISDESLGALQLYSSGTTGRPKSSVPTLSSAPVEDGVYGASIHRMYGFDADTVYLSPAPLYHAAPAVFSIAVQSLGGTVVMMERFDAHQALRLIDQYDVTHSQWVPTMFIRMLALPEEERLAFDHSSLKLAVHSAAPCPVSVKQAMIDWWGPIITEYYGGSEAVGTTVITSPEWLEHRGSVGRSMMGSMHVCYENGTEVPVGETGLIYFEHQLDPSRTSAGVHPVHATWASYGDIGYVDSDGYLYLTDRSSFMIVSGGVNIYPREIEEALGEHPAIADVAVFGVPNDEFGEEVKAVVELWPSADPSDELVADLHRFARSKLATYKCPRSIEIVEQLPRMPTGKLAKRLLRDPYWADRSSKIV